MNGPGKLILFIAALGGSLLAAAPQQTHHSSKRTTPAAEKPAAESSGESSFAEITRENNYGVALMNRQQFEAALAKFTRACIMDPQSDVGCTNMGIALLNMQKFDEAQKLLEKAAQLHPRNPVPWFNLGLIEKAEGQPQAAIADFQKASELDPDDADSHYFIGLMYAQQQENDKAIPEFEAALKINPFHLSAEFGLAQALMRTGHMDQAKAHLERFEHMNAEKLGRPISFTYGDQGKYSLAQQMAPIPEAVPALLPVHFKDVTPTSGLPWRAETREATQRVEPRSSMRRATHALKESTEETLAQYLGSGACVLDYDGDGKPDIFLVNADGKGDAGLYRNLGHGRFENVTLAAKLGIHGQATSCAVGDYDNDGHPDLAVGFNGRVALYRNLGNGAFQDVTEAAGIHVDGLVLGLTFVDFDHDGDLDLYVTRFGDFPLGYPSVPLNFPKDAPGPGNMMWRNNGNGTFTDWTKETGLAGTSPSVGAIASDVNNDRAIDLVVTGWRIAPTIYLNPREGEFRQAAVWSSEMPGPTAGVVALDYNKDGWMDYGFTHWAPPGVSLWRNNGGKSLDRVQLPDLEWARGWGIAALDYDDDGWVDIVAVGENFAGEGKIALFRNEGAAGFRDVTAETGLDKVVLHNPRGVVAFDYDGDGATDLLITQQGLPPVLLKNEGGNQYKWLQIALKGTNDNKSAIGTKVELYAGALQQKWEVPGGSGYLGQGPTEITAGLGVEYKADVVRMLWPTGVLQDELNVSTEKRTDFVEIDRRGSSCPIVFVWNGQKFQFLSDIIGPGIVGHWTGPNQRNYPDPDEYLKVAGTDVQTRDGKIEFRMIEPMEELDYLDQARLIAVDHPWNVEVYPNEHFASEPPFPKFKVIASEDAHSPAGVWDDAGHDLLPLLKERDRKYVTDFPSTPYAGFAAMHSIVIDLGPWNPSHPLRLLMDGFTDYFSASSMYAAWQAGIKPVPPYVEALTDPGKWQRVVDDMGFPAGLSRTMVADLTGKLPEGTRFIRISTNLKIYWDRIRVDNSPADLPYKLTQVPLASATLGYRGYPRVVEGNPVDDLTYVYEDVSSTGPYTRQTGNYTRYGDVTPLLTETDDKYVIFGSGDEVKADFDPSSLPPVAEGWVRDYFFYADGFAKDMDFYAAYGDTVSPMPFHTPLPFPYPPGVAYPEDRSHLQYELEYNTRGVAGPSGPEYIFQYKPVKNMTSQPSGR
ncbi:MAG TPA: FG-GAP-like repeat-containing protein [Verrucomicrobiae bacterium]|nr:FG-GAP-like repeat-containing protein [Verrucomicrobiae bacterium]